MQALYFLVGARRVVEDRFMKISRALLWGPLALGLLACIPIPGGGSSSTYDDSDWDSWSSSSSTGCDDVDGVSRYSAEQGDPCSGGGGLADCGADDPYGYPARWICDQGSCTWRIVDSCDSHPDPGCNVCQDMQCFESAAGSCG